MNMYFFNGPQVEEETVTDVRTKTENTKAIVLYNDDFNTFEFVTESLIKVCGHDPLQAEQCTYLVHYTGKCAVKLGTLRELRPPYEALLERGLTARIED
jgi:ATP-dependent Clp protease adaptor protein ClpS